MLGFHTISDDIRILANGYIYCKGVIANSKGFTLYDDNEFITKSDLEFYITDKYYSKELADIRFVTYSNFAGQISLYDLQNSSQVGNTVSGYLSDWFANTHYITDVNFGEQIVLHDLISSSYLSNYILTVYDNFNDYLTLTNIHEINGHVQNMIDNHGYDKSNTDALFVSYANIFENVENIASSLRLTNEAYVGSQIDDLENSVSLNYYVKGDVDSMVSSSNANIDNLSTVLSNQYYTKQNIDALFDSNDISDFEFFQNSISTSLATYYDKSNVDALLTNQLNDLRANIAHEANVVNNSLVQLEAKINANVDSIEANHLLLSNTQALFETVCFSNIDNLSNICVDLNANITDVNNRLMSDYYERTTIDSKVQIVNDTLLTSVNNTLTGYYDKTSVDTLLESQLLSQQSNIMDTVQNNHYTKAFVDTEYYTRSYIDTEFNTVLQLIGNVSSPSESSSNVYDISNIDAMFYTKTNIDTMFAEHDATHNNNLIVTLQDYYDKDEIDNIVSNVSNDANNVNNGISESDFGNLLAPYLEQYSTTNEISAFYTPLSFLNIYYNKTAADARFLNVNDVDNMLSSLSFVKESVVDSKLQNYYFKTEVDSIIAASLADIASGGNITINPDAYLTASNAEAFYVQKQNFGQYFDQSMYKVDSQIEHYLTDYLTEDDLRNTYVTQSNVESILTVFNDSFMSNAESLFYSQANADALFHKKTDFVISDYYLKTEVDNLFLSQADLSNLVSVDYLSLNNYNKTESDNLFITHAILNDRLSSLPTASNISSEISGALLLNYYTAATSDSLYVKHSDFDSKITSYELQNRNDVNNRINENLANYYTTTQIDNLYIGYADFPSIITQQGLLTQMNASSTIAASLSNYYTQVEANNKFIAYDNFTQALISNSVATHSFVSEQINSSFNDYYNKSYINDTFLSKAGFDSEILTYDIATSSTVNTMIDSKLASYRAHLSDGVNYDIEAYLQSKFGPQTEIISYSGGGLVTKFYVDNLYNSVTNTIESYIDDDNDNTFLNKVQQYLTNGDLNTQLTNSMRTLLLGSALDESLEFNYVIRDLYNRVSSNNTFEITYNSDTSSWNGAMYSLYLSYLVAVQPG